MTPKHAWALAFAEMFDRENELRRALGMVPKARPYTGTIDPQKAITNIKLDPSASTSNQPPPPPPDAQDPQTAVNAIALGLRYTHQRQRDALAAVHERLLEPPPPRQPSLFDTILEVAVNVAIGGVAGALGGALSERLKSAFDGAAKGNAKRIADDVLKIGRGLEKSAGAKLREDFITRSVRGGAIHRAAAVDGAKDASKVFFRSTSRCGLRSPKVRTAPRP